MRIALTGNPNSGKTTMYNALTGRTERVGNWAGVTVDKKESPIKKVYYDGEYLDEVNIVSDASQGVGMLSDISSFVSSMMKDTLKNSQKPRKYSMLWEQRSKTFVFSVNRIYKTVRPHRSDREYPLQSL